MTGPQIRPEQPEDHAAVAAVVGEAFATEPAVVGMVEAIRSSDRYRDGLAFVALDDREIVGFVMLSGTDLMDEGGTAREILTLTPLAVSPSHQCRGIGGALIRTAVSAADALGEPVIVVEGDPRYYGRHGFVAAANHGIVIDLPEWAPPEAAQVQLLTQYDPQLRGRVIYPPAIAAVSG